MNYYQRYMRKLKTGRRISPRGMSVTAVYNVTYNFTPGTAWRREKDNPSIGIVEGLQFIAGVENKEAISKIAPRVDLDLFGPTSFYGVRVVGQIERVINELRKDPNSRRAVLFVAHEDDTSETMPCTMNIVYYIGAKGELNSTINMRSSDAVWGLPYDQIQFGMLQIAIANSLGIQVGLGTINIVNAHIYDDHPGGTQWEMHKFSMPLYGQFADYVSWANSIIERITSDLWNRQMLEEYFQLHE